MPIINERREVSKNARVEALARRININPAGLDLNNPVDPYAVKQPAEEAGIVTVVWARQDNVLRKKSIYGAEVVPASEAERYGQGPDQCDKVNDCIYHRSDRAKLVLMRYPNPDLLLRRQAMGPFRALSTYRADIEQFNADAQAVQLDSEGMPIRKRNAYKNVNSVMQAQAEKAVATRRPRQLPREPKAGENPFASMLGSVPPPGPDGSGTE